MELTKEQLDIIQSAGNIKINAVAGSGKTTTMIEYAKARPKSSRILYLAFNKSVKLEAARKFADKGLDNVKVETAHSLAYKHIVFSNNYRVRAQGYKTHEIAELLGLQGNGEKHTEYIVANHINKFIAYFCNSDKRRVQELNYLDVVTDDKARTFVTTFYDYIERHTRLLLAKMDKGEIEITHDFYLKKFQLSQPQLYYDYILFDEGQDASAAMLDIFLNQQCTKVIVGDTHQQIYSWRFAVNSLEKAQFTNYNLSTSFRFSPDIAHLAQEVLQWKEIIKEHQPIVITGKGTSKEIKVKAVIGRTNLGLLLKAIEYVMKKGKVDRIYFEGNIHSYTYADEGASLYDVLNLFNNKRGMIKDKLIQEMKDMKELEYYIEKTEDMQLGMMVEIVKEYGNDIFDIIKTIKEKHVENEDKEKAEMIFSTVHRCKGMEYDTVQLVDDFITEEKLEKQKAEGIDDAGIAKLNEEINLLYVAVTRTKNTLYIPKMLMPDEFPLSPQIIIMQLETKEEKDKKEALNNSKKQGRRLMPLKENKETAYTYDDVRQNHKEAYKPWTEEEDDELTTKYLKGISARDIAKHFGRTKGAIEARIKKLDLQQIYGLERM